MDKQIYGMRPVNGTAASVTSQAGCTVELTPEQVRENLVAGLKALDERIKLLPKNSPIRKELGLEKFNLQQKIIAIRPKRKAPGVQQYFMDVARENLSKFEFNRWMDAAVIKMKEDSSLESRSE